MKTLPDLRIGDVAMVSDRYGNCVHVIDAVDAKWIRIGRSRYSRHDGRQVGAGGVLRTMEQYEAAQAALSARARLSQLGVGIWPGSKVDPVRLLKAMVAEGMVSE